MNTIMFSVIAAVVLLVFVSSKIRMKIGSITTEELKEQMAVNKNLILIDVRSKEEYHSGHIQGAVCIPLEAIEGKIGTVVPDINTYFVMYCAHGSRASVAYSIVKRLKYSNVKKYAGSVNAWVGSGNKLVR